MIHRAPVHRALLSVFAFVACSPPVLLDASTDAGDANMADASTLDAAPALDAAPGGACSFNDDCVTAERCACSAGACRCEPGARGAGRAGMDGCTSGNDCESALCVEGPGGPSLCSAACARDGECPTALPRCTTVPTVGSFCARDPRGDAGTDGAAGVPGCEGACARTDLAAAFGARMGGFERAQHGVSGADGIYVEAHFGGDPACPSETSPTPRRTLIVSGLRALAAGGVITETDGLRVTLLDFDGTLTSAPLLRASAARATARYVDRGSNVSFTLDATFSEGTLRGGFFAPHCDSLDRP